jgi:hypothetical protein
MKRSLPLTLVGAVVGTVAIALGCAGIKQGTPGNGGSGGSGNGTGTGGRGASNGGAGGQLPPPTCMGQCTDFPADPVTDGNVPSNAGQIFGGGGNPSGGPCLLEPQLSEAGTGVAGALFPNNWLRPRFRILAPAPSGQDLFEIRVHAGNQQNDLVIYTTNTIWTMPKDMWQALAAHSYDMPITVTVRGASQGGGTPSVGSQGDFTIAPVEAGGKMVYWSTMGSTNGTPSNADTLLSGFAVGDESVVTVLTPGQPLAAGGDVAKDLGGNPLPPTSHCIGCHTATPDGAFISYNDFYPWDVVIASATSNPPGAAPGTTILSASGYTLINGRPQLAAGGSQIGWLGISTYTREHWAETATSAPGTDEHLMVTSFGHAATSDVDPLADLVWIDLHATSTARGLGYGIIARNGDTQGAAAPVWGRVDGSFIVYTSTNSEKSGRLGSGTAHLYKVEWGNRAGGVAAPLLGGSTPGFAEYYPALTSDDRMVAFNRIDEQTAMTSHTQIGGAAPGNWDGMYAQPKAEVYVAPLDVDNPMRLAANDPPSCMGTTRGTINNTWAKWSPEVVQAGGKTYYWLIFSSWRDGLHASDGAPIAQLYVTGVVQSETGMQTFGAIYLWNQPVTISNHTPYWDVFQIPVVN